LLAQDKKLVAGMQKEVKKVDRTFFQSRGASESTLYRKRNFLVIDDDEVLLLSATLMSLFTSVPSCSVILQRTSIPLLNMLFLAVSRNRCNVTKR
jgi:hypothetical protein